MSPTHLRGLAKWWHERHNIDDVFDNLEGTKFGPRKVEGISADFQAFSAGTCLAGMSSMYVADLVSNTTEDTFPLWELENSEPKIGGD